MARTRRYGGETSWLLRWLRIVERLEPPARRRPGHPDRYASGAMMKAFFVMTVKKIKRFQGLWNYLSNNAPVRRACGFPRPLPHPRTFGRRFQRLADELGDWMQQAAAQAVAKRYITLRWSLLTNRCIRRVVRSGIRSSAAVGNFPRIFGA